MRNANPAALPERQDGDDADLEITLRRAAPRAARVLVNTGSDPA